MFKFAAKTVYSNSISQDETPRVTVAIPIYNHSHYVIETLDSVAAQTLKNIDIVVVDDKSTDDSLLVVSRWLHKNRSRFKSINLLSNVANYGLSETRNNAFSAARTELVFALDSDNIIYPRCLEVLVGVADRTNAAAVYSQLEVFGEEKDVGYAWVWDKNLLALSNYIDAMALIRKTEWQAVGGYSQLEGIGWEDYDFWLKLASRGSECVFVPQILCRYRVDKKSMLRTETKEDTMMLESNLSFKHFWREIKTKL